LNNLIRICFSPFISSRSSYPAQSISDAVEKLNKAFQMKGFFNSPNLSGKFISANKFIAKPRWEFSYSLSNPNIRLSNIKGQIIKNGNTALVNIEIAISPFFKYLLGIILLSIPISLVYSIIQQKYLPFAVLLSTYVLLYVLIETSKKDSKNSIQEALYKKL
jgi:hypothetical protein